MFFFFQLKQKCTKIKLLLKSKIHMSTNFYTLGKSSVYTCMQNAIIYIELML